MPVVGIRKKNGDFVLRQKLVKDSNGAPSKTLAQTGKISNSGFWDKFHEIVDFLIRHDIPLFDIGSANILVRRVSKTKLSPFLFDYKEMGAKYYPFQPWLLLRAGRRAKILRRAERIERKFRG